MRSWHSLILQTAQLLQWLMDNLDKKRRAGLRMTPLAQLAWCQLAQVARRGANDFSTRHNLVLGEIGNQFCIGAWKEQLVVYR